MVAFANVFAAVAALLATANAVPTAIMGRVEQGTPCGVEPAPGIRKPKNNTTVTYTAKEQANLDGATFEVIYCSGDYFKTSSLGTTVLLSQGIAPTASGMILGFFKPDSSAASPGFYGYKFNVTIYPEDGYYLTGPYLLSVFETETGYYNANNFQIHSINLNLKTANSTY